MSAGGDPRALLPAGAPLLAARVALAGEERARAAWEALRALPMDDLSGTVHRLLPLVSRRLDAWGRGEELARKHRGVARYHWARNRLLLDRLEDLAPLLTKREGGALALGGLVSLLEDEASVSLRPLDRAVFLFPAGEGAEAARRLGARGWTVTGRGPRHVGLVGEGGLALELRESWCDLPLSVTATEALHRETVGAGPFGLRLPSRLLRLWWSLVSSPADPMWFLDGASLLDEGGRDMDWERIYALVETTGRGLAARLGLGFLCDELDRVVPDALRRRIASLPVTELEDLFMRAAGGLGLMDRLRLRWLRLREEARCQGGSTGLFALVGRLVRSRRATGGWHSTRNGE